MEQYLIDTNIVSDYLSASFPPNGMALMNKVIDAVPKISIITQIELLCWNTDKGTTQSIIEFISDSIILEISPEVIAHCVTLRKGRKLKLQMLSLPSTALANNLILLSRNITDFKKLDSLQIIDPYNL